MNAPPETQMRQEGRAHDRRVTFMYALVGIAAAAYCAALVLQPQPVEPQAFPISDTLRLALKITVAMPILLVWFLGAASIAESLRHADESPDVSLRVRYRLLGRALAFLVAGLIVGTLIGQLRSYYGAVPSVRKISTILVNYTYVFPPLIGFWLLYRASRTNGKRPIFGQNDIVAATLVAIVGALWTAVIFTNPDRQTSLVTGVSASFYLSDTMILASIVVPTLLSWFFGIRAALELADVSAGSNARGHEMYRLVSGIWLLIFSYIIVLGLLSAGGERLLAFGLAGVLVAIYLFLFVLFAAHWLVASAIRRLGEAEVV